MEHLTEKEIRNRQLHLKLGEMNLQGLVDSLVHHVLEALRRHVEIDETNGRFVEDLRVSVEEVLRRHVVAMDICGLSVLCTEASEYDPWPAKDNKPLS